MIKEAIDRIIELKRPETIINKSGREYSTVQIKGIEEPMCLWMNTAYLSSLVAYIKENPDNIKGQKIIQITSPVRVKLVGTLFGDWRQREGYMDVNCDNIISDFPESYWFNQNEFIIKLSSMFKHTEELQELLKIVSNIVDTNSVDYMDDGVSSEVVIKSGIARKETAMVDNRVTLQPFRTFLEIAQPKSEFVLRIEKDKYSKEIKFALFEADGGAWKKEAIENIKEYLNSNLEGVKDLTILY